MKKLLCLLFAAFLLCVSASALELPSGLDDVVPRELIDSAEAGDDLLLRGGQYLFSHFRAALQDAVVNSLRGAMALMLLSLLCGLIEGTAESAGETPTRYAGYLGVLGAVALSAGDLSALIGLGVETMDELSTMAKLLLPTIAAAMAGGGCVGSASVWQVGALMLSDIFLSLMRDVLVPVLYCMIGTAAAGALLEQSRLSLLSKGIGKLLSWGLSAILIVFTAFLSVSNLLAGSADRLAVKVGKTVISGAVPVVRSTGGLADTVRSCQVGQEDGTGYLFGDYDAGAMLSVIGQATGLYRGDRTGFDTVRYRGMTADFSWGRSAAAYRHIYENL